MAYMNRFSQSDEGRRDELIRIIEYSVEKLTLAELEALYYDMTTKSFINDLTSLLVSRSFSLVLRFSTTMLWMA